MGYYSDIKLITTKEGWKKLEQATSKVRSKDDTAYWVTSEAEVMTLCDGKYALAEWNSVKWYEGNMTDVDVLMATLKTFDDQNIPYDYMRTGEEYDDFDRQYGDANWADDYKDMPHLELVREITIEY